MKILHTTLWVIGFAVVLIIGYMLTHTLRYTKAREVCQGHGFQYVEWVRGVNVRCCRETADGKSIECATGYSETVNFGNKNL